MNCLRCGKEVEPGQVFCQECLITAEKYPVSPNASFSLPLQRQTAPVRKPAKKRTVPLEEQVQILRRRLRFFVFWSVVTTVLVALMARPAIAYLLEDHFALGQNYSTFTTQTTAATEPTELSQTLETIPETAADPA